MNVSLRLLRVFLAVSREGNVGRAAAALYVSQPSLSQDIRRLERELGAELFVRGPQGVTLTPVGEGFRRDVEDALGLLDRAVEHVRSSQRSGRRRIVLGFSPSIGHELMPALLPLLEERIPGAYVDEREVDTGAVAAGVRSGVFDIGLAHCQEPEEGLEAVALRDEPLCVALPSNHVLARRGGTLELRELDALPLMIWPREVAPRYFDTLVAICRDAGLAPEVVAGPRRAMIRSYAVSEGRVFCLLPLATAHLNVPGVSFVRVADPHAVVELDLVRRSREERPEVRAACEVVLAEAVSL